MRLIVDEITRAVSSRKRSRAINRTAVTNSLGRHNLNFSAEFIKVVEWKTIRKEPEENCDCFGCEVSSVCEKLNYRYRLDLESMDLMRSISECNNLFVYVDFDSDKDEIEGALQAILGELSYIKE